MLTRAACGGNQNLIVCASVGENSVALLACPENPPSVLSAIDAVYWGTPSGVCGAYAPGPCNQPGVTSVVRADCVGRPNCSIASSNNAWGDPCSGTVRLALISALRPARLRVLRRPCAPPRSSSSSAPFAAQIHGRARPLLGADDDSVRQRGRARRGVPCLPGQRDHFQHRLCIVRDADWRLRRAELRHVQLGQLVCRSTAAVLGPKQLLDFRRQHFVWRPL